MEVHAGRRAVDPDHPGVELPGQPQRPAEIAREHRVHCAIPSGDAESDTGPVDAAAALRKTLLVARMDPRTTVREGEAAKIAVDLAALHFFDPGTGDRIGT